jgi:hypothetical protein
MNPTLVFFKCVVSGPVPKKDRILEFAGIAYDCLNYQVTEEVHVEIECGAHERLTARVGNLAVPEYEQVFPIGETEALAQIAAFLGRHSTVEKVSKAKQQKFRVARLVGHGVAKLDFPMLRVWFEGRNEFLPADPFVADLVQLEGWLEPKRMAENSYDELLEMFDPLRPPPNRAPVYTSPALAYVRNSLRRARELWDEVLAQVIP